FFAGNLIRDLLLYRHRRPVARIFDLQGDLVRHFRCARTLLLRIFEDAEAFKSSVPNEIEQPFEFLFGFPRKSDNESRAQGNSRNSGAQFIDQILDVCARCFALPCGIPRWSQSIHHSSAPGAYKADAPKIRRRSFESREVTRKGSVLALSQSAEAAPLSPATSPFHNTLYPG